MGIEGLLPEHILNKMSPEDRKKLGKAGVTIEEAFAKAEAKNEKELQSQIASYLRRNDIWFDCPAMHKKPTSVVGRPDFIFAIKGRACAMEVKTKTGKVKAEQTACHLDMIPNGWFVKVVRSYDEAVAFVKAMEELT